MRTSRVLAVLAAAAVLAFAPAAPAGELSGVKMPDTLDAGGKALKLNGMGLRKKAIFKVYVGGLYLEAPSKDASVATADVPKAMRMQFMRSVGKDKIAEGFHEGFEANAKAQAAAQKANVDKFVAALPDMQDGGVITYTYVPGKGTTVTLGDKELVTIEGKEFGDALFLVWLGPKPPTEDLKKGLLGS